MKVPQTSDPATLARLVPGFPLRWMRHVCGGRSMPVSCFESIRHKVRQRRGRRRHEPPGVPERREGREPEWQSAPSSATLHLGETLFGEVEQAIKGAVTKEAADDEGAAQAVTGSCASSRRPPVLSHHQKQAMTMVESGFGLCDEWRRRGGVEGCPFLFFSRRSVGPRTMTFEADASDLCHVIERQSWFPVHFLVVS